MKDDYLETIEHEMVHVEDYFSNHKIAFTEKMAKLHFLQNLKGTVTHDKIYDCIDRSKKQLVEIKKKGVEVRDCIEQLSKDIYELEKETVESASLLELEEKEVKELEEQLESVEKELENNEEYGRINSQFEAISEQVKAKSDQIGALEKEITELRASELESEYQKLKEEKEKLESKQKRLSVIQYEKFIEDLYYHYETYKSFLLKVLDTEIISTSCEDQIIIKCKNKQMDIEIVIVNGELEDIRVIQYNRKDTFNPQELLRHYKRIGDPRYLICHIVFH